MTDDNALSRAIRSGVLLLVAVVLGLWLLVQLLNLLVRVMGAAGTILAVPIAGFAAVLLQEIRGQAGSPAPTLTPDVLLDGVDGHPLVRR